MSQHGSIDQLLLQMKQQMEQITELQVFVVTHAKREREGEIASRSNNVLNTEMARLFLFNGEASKVVGFVTVYKLYIKMRIKEISVKEQ